MKAAFILTLFAAGAVALPNADPFEHALLPRAVADEFPAQCRTLCASTIDMSSCLAKANPDAIDSSTGLPQLTNVNGINDATKACYKTDLCPKLNEYVSCLQCVIAVADVPVATKNTLADGFNGAMPQVAKYCDVLGAKAPKYAALAGDGKIPSGARSNAAGSILLTLGAAAAASFL